MFMRIIHKGSKGQLHEFETLNLAISPISSKRRDIYQSIINRYKTKTEVTSENAENENSINLPDLSNNIIQRKNSEGYGLFWYLIPNITGILF